MLGWSLLVLGGLATLLLRGLATLLLLGFRQGLATRLLLLGFRRGLATRLLLGFRRDWAVLGSRLPGGGASRTLLPGGGWKVLGYRRRCTPGWTPRWTPWTVLLAGWMVLLLE
jgi:hypothetical protein